MGSTLIPIKVFHTLFQVLTTTLIRSSQAWSVVCVCGWSVMVIIIKIYITLVSQLYSSYSSFLIFVIILPIFVSIIITVGRSGGEGWKGKWVGCIGPSLYIKCVIVCTIYLGGFWTQLCAVHCVHLVGFCGGTSDDSDPRPTSKKSLHRQITDFLQSLKFRPKHSLLQTVTGFNDIYGSFQLVGLNTTIRS